MRLFGMAELFRLLDQSHRDVLRQTLTFVITGEGP
jgi:hypothetical protein